MSENSDKKEAIAEILLKILKSRKIKTSKEDIIQKIAVPPSSEMGDFAFPCFFLASILKGNPNDIALEIAGEVKAVKGIKEVRTQGPYINFFIDREKLTEDIISRVLSEKNEFGASNLGKGKKVICNY